MIEGENELRVYATIFFLLTHKYSLAIDMHCAMFLLYYLNNVKVYEY